MERSFVVVVVVVVKYKFELGSDFKFQIIRNTNLLLIGVGKANLSGDFYCYSSLDVMGLCSRD